LIQIVEISSIAIIFAVLGLITANPAPDIHLPSELSSNTVGARNFLWRILE
jgi:hypothetical protein